MADRILSLVFLNTARAGESVPLLPGDFFIGRSRANAVVLEDPLVSRKHARIVADADHVVAEDLDSAHGTFLNDKRVRGAVSLNNGDVLQLGDVKLRFVVTAGSAADQCTLCAGGPEPEPSASHATGFAQASGGGETRFMPPPKPPSDDDVGKTRVIAEGETRFMDEGEFKGLRAAPRSPVPRRILLPIAALVTMLVVIGAVWLFTRGNEPGNGTGMGISHTDDRYAFHVSAPSGWKLTQGSEGAVFGFEFGIQGSRSPARMDAYADRQQDYSITGLQIAFNAYIDTITARHPGMKLQRMVMTVNNATGVFYAFTSSDCSGKGFFILTGNKRICIECSCPPHCANMIKTVFPDMLRTFRLTEPQQFIDFPPPSEAVRKIALANREHLAAMSKRDLDTGNDLLKNRDVRSENLYLARRALQGCMTTASALGERPPFYCEAALKLAEAGSALETGLRDQKLRILVAEHKHDIERAYWESVKLAEMMPEKNSEIHQFAAKRITFYAKLREK